MTDLKKKKSCPRFEIFAFPKACLWLRVLLSVPKRSCCPKITNLHENFQCFSISAVSCKQISSAPDAPPPSSSSIFLFARKDTIFDDTLFFVTYCSKQYLFFCFSGQLFLGSQAKFVLRTVWVCCRTGWLQVMFTWSPILTLLKVLS